MVEKDDRNETPTRAQQRIWLESLTEKEILKSMDDCDDFGLDHFLENRRFGMPQKIGFLEKIFMDLKRIMKIENNTQLKRLWRQR